jgi:hypothetical protein
MRKTFLIGSCAVAAALAVGLAYAESRKKGPCKLQKAGPFNGKGKVKVTVGEKVKARAEFYISEFFGRKIINAGAHVENTTEKNMHYRYYVAFFDKKGALIGCTGQGSFGKDGMKPGRKTQLGSCLIALPPEKFKEVASYQVVLYESEKPIGSK